jgi:hypothetical protein
MFYDRWGWSDPKYKEVVFYMLTQIRMSAVELRMIYVPVDLCFLQCIYHVVWMNTTQAGEYAVQLSALLSSFQVDLIVAVFVHNQNQTTITPYCRSWISSAHFSRPLSLMVVELTYWST